MGERVYQSLFLDI